MAPLQYTSTTFPTNVETSTIDVPQAEIALFISRPPAKTTTTQESKKLPIIALIHGNSTSSMFWLPIFKSPLCETHKILAFDLPGHGASGDAREEYGLKNIYSQQGYAKIARTVIESFIQNEGASESDVVVFGNSLGGHIAIELCNLMMSTSGKTFSFFHEYLKIAVKRLLLVISNFRAALVTVEYMLCVAMANIACEKQDQRHESKRISTTVGTIILYASRLYQRLIFPARPFDIVGLIANDASPLSNGNFTEAFVPSELMKYAAAEHWSEDDIKQVAEHVIIGPAYEFMFDAFRRTDSRARPVMFETSLDGSSVCDQRACVEKLTWNGHGSSGRGPGDKRTIVAVINGSEEKTINFEYLHHGINWGPGLWTGKCIEIRGEKPSGHLPFLEDWDGFWPYLRDFIADVSKL